MNQKNEFSKKPDYQKKIESAFLISDTLSPHQMLILSKAIEDRAKQKAGIN